MSDRASKGGRPGYQPSDKEHDFVRAMAAVGCEQSYIARTLKISEPTLRKHFRSTLDNAAADANYAVARTLFKMATSGQHASVSIFWARTRMGWCMAQAPADPGAQPDERLGKKEQAQRDAWSAGVGTDWGEDLKYHGAFPN